LSHAGTSRPPSTGRWILSFLVLSSLGFIGFVGYRKYVAPAPAPLAGSAADARSAGFLQAGWVKLAEGDFDGAEAEFHKATGIDDAAPAPYQGLVAVELGRAELAWWRVLAATEDQRSKRLSELRGSIGAARKAVDTAFTKSPGPEGKAQLEAARRRLAAMMIHALAVTGDRQRAKEELEPLSRTSNHPQVKVLRELLEGDAPPAAGASASASAAAEAADAGADDAPKAKGDGDKPSAHAARHGDEREEFEFQHEPVLPGPQPGELTLPAGKKKVELPPD
jgi:hypothetical protein